MRTTVKGSRTSAATAPALGVDCSIAVMAFVAPRKWAKRICLFAAFRTIEITDCGGLRGRTVHGNQGNVHLALGRGRGMHSSNCTEPANHNPATTHAKAEFARESEGADRQERLD